MTTTKIPSSFTSHDEWLEHVRQEIPADEQPYALAYGRMELFRTFHRMSGIPFPTQFTVAFEHIENLDAPERTVALESLNNTIFRSLTTHLFNNARQTIFADDTHLPAAPQKHIEELRSHLARKNPYFALWNIYKTGVSDHSVAAVWEEYLLHELGSRGVDEIDFARAMVELDKLLNHYRDENRALPSFAFERVWFLHYLRGPERMAQTRAVLGMLTAELRTCTSA
ncbi:hypothetical protein DYQ86_05210 [Acidobacteria bacterium AB60]|nr:hypothetical protein DYQ86_05210 [Acidobacteria bacterium AB60]